ncbi:MAG: DUF559 domain-containing protein [Hamadaea sp.]|uniref:DUF559 domain-containing protein n=1 Tax=Hamadaea sp. TaxID=2024425 RepID=UPI0017E6D5F9|nr:DUF559 domain-containing protein [Hamadaea sp.]NUR70601.1 DUF559 domain-containing protein [Hamadaea sp.]NUT19270.1 DUF559 domain-containing protein [Hamadaea sp.]
MRSSSSPFRARDWLAAGLLTRDELRGSRWRRLFRGVYVDSGVRVDHELWCSAAALLPPPGGAIGLLSAAALWNVPLLRSSEDPVTVVVPLSAKLRTQDHLVVHRMVLEPGDVESRRGVPVTSALRTAFDLARLLPRVDAVIALDALFQRRRVSPDQVLAYTEAHSGWPSVRSGRVALSLSDGRAESVMETRLRLLLVDGGLPEPDLQVRITRTLPDGRVRVLARVDLAYEEWKLALEYDGDHHRERETHRKDMTRQNELYVEGWTVLRFNADDVLRFPDRTVATVRAMLLRLGWRP